MKTASCLDCTHCGPVVGECIRCDAPIWAATREEGEDDTDMREIHPSFAETCSDFEPKTKNEAP